MKVKGAKAFLRLNTHRRTFRFGGAIFYILLRGHQVISLLCCYRLSKKKRLLFRTVSARVELLAFTGSFLD